ncbi:TIGR03943 family protein [Acaryochloris sp. IP29b_bin.148]|uniref:TIGR03943 family putative permease subunit n=1 Tax=Acaryochloris sp. IP29b_bin.148 TaxID=2969218 RepID=UPI0026062726|nr:TIGR03943 family protein [Acaryochloris sp. IP29b_bin.148]
MTAKRLRTKLFPYLPEGLVTLALGLWGTLILHYWRSGKLGLLIHPNYYGLTLAAGYFLLMLTVLQILKLWRRRLPMRAQHLSLLSPPVMSSIMLVAALIGLLVTPRPFTSQTAIQRGLQDTTLVTRARPQAFRTTSNPEKRTLLEWIRTLDVYPEPDAYAGQKVNVDGFVVYPEDLPDNYFTLTRFVISCCAADAYPVGLPVKLEGNRKTYAVDSWQAIQGEMMTETLNGQRQLVIQAKALKPIPEPDNPYYY